MLAVARTQWTWVAAQFMGDTKFNRVFSEDSLKRISIGILAIYLTWILFGPLTLGHDTIFALGLLTSWQKALLAGDWFPTWTPFHTHGLGAPTPFFYHKLFDLIGGALSVALDNVLAAMHAGIAFFTLVLLYGVYACALRMGMKKKEAFALAVAAILSPYAIAEWFERSAVAEYSAMALTPWMIAQALDVERGSIGARTSFLIFLLLCLLAVAHLTIFLFVVALLFCHAASLMVRRKPGGFGLLLVNAIALLLFIFLIYEPFSYLSLEFNPDRASLVRRPDENTVPWINMVASWQYPGRWFGWTVVALVVALIASFRQRPWPHLATAKVIGLVAMALIVLMSPIANPLWRLSDQLLYIQFPWRMLAVATPLIFVAFAGMLAEIGDRLRLKLLIAMLGLSMLYSVTIIGGLFFHRYARDRVVTAEQVREAPFVVGAEIGSEYLPAAFRQSLSLSSLPVNPILPTQRMLVEAMSGCVISPALERQHFRLLQAHASCHVSGLVRINQFFTSFLEAYAVSGSQVVKPVSGALTIDFELPAGEWELRVRVRSYLELVAWSWQRRRL